ncbi:7904_t:CDS:2 [Gigaspora margarita]|uniref:7904_t:CDS:1 n=1 Tax=Gigaspora margarita TaxID=4874 RepID=A0ABN7UBH7_GIGMA|nr:7904_t:CDS:2 [Gigaspora margarita]
MHQKNERVSIIESESKKKKMKHNAQRRKANNNTKAKELPPTMKKEVPNKTPNDEGRSHRNR